MISFSCLGFWFDLYVAGRGILNDVQIIIITKREYGLFRRDVLPADGECRGSGRDPWVNIDINRTLVDEIYKCNIKRHFFKFNQGYDAIRRESRVVRIQVEQAGIHGICRVIVASDARDGGDGVWDYDDIAQIEHAVESVPRSDVHQTKVDVGFWIGLGYLEHMRINNVVDVALSR